MIFSLRCKWFRFSYKVISGLEILTKKNENPKIQTIKFSLSWDISSFCKLHHVIWKIILDHLLPWLIPYVDIKNSKLLQKDPLMCHITSDSKMILFYRSTKNISRLKKGGIPPIKKGDNQKGVEDSKKGG